MDAPGAPFFQQALTLASGFLGHNGKEVQAIGSFLSTEVLALATETKLFLEMAQAAGTKLAPCPVHMPTERRHGNP